MSSRQFTTLTGENIRLWLLLAFQAGAVNAGGFIACKRFVTHTTGFATHFAYELGHRDFSEASGMLVVPFFFLLGAMLSSYFVDLPHHRGEIPNFRIPAFLIFTTLLSATILGEWGIFGEFGSQLRLDKDFYLMTLLCLASGLQNALVTSASGSVRTTHLTGVTTDLAAGLVRLIFSRAATGRASKEGIANIARIGIIGAFILGSTASVFLFMRADYLGFLLPVFTSIIMLWNFNR